MVGDKSIYSPVMRTQLAQKIAEDISVDHQQSKDSEKIIMNLGYNIIASTQRYSRLESKHRVEKTQSMPTTLGLTNKSSIQMQPDTLRPTFLY
jgi:hypothetical protein